MPKYWRLDPGYCSGVIKDWVHAGDGLRTTTSSKSSSYTFDVGDGGCFGCCCSSCAFFFSSTLFWAVDLLTSVSAAVLSHTRFSNRLLFFHAELVHVFNNSSCIVAVSPYKHEASPFYWVKSLYMCIRHQTCFFLQTCKSRKNSCIFAKAKNKIKKDLMGLEPSTLLSVSLDTTVFLTAPSNRL